MDAVISASTLVAAGIYLFFGVGLEAWLGAVISLVIIKSGIEMLQEALDKILGERVDGETSIAVKQTVSSVPGVRGAYDLILTDYGPQRLQGSVHVEVDEKLTAREIDGITREIQARTYRETGVVLHTVGVYSTNTEDGTQAAAIRAELEQIVREDNRILQFHGLYVDEELKGATFDLVVGFDAPDRRAVLRQTLDRLQERFPEYAFDAVLDTDISD